MSISLKVEGRKNFGTSATKEVRRRKLIPAVIYSKGHDSLGLSVDVKEFEREYFKGTALTSIFEIELDGKKLKVIPHKIDLDPVSDRPRHVDFLLCENSKEVRAKPKLVFANQDKSVGLKKGGFLHIILRRLEVVCDNEKLVPDSIEVDIISLNVGQKIRAKDLSLPEGVRLVKKNNFLIASIIGRGKAEEETKAATDVAAASNPASTAAPSQAGKAAAPKKDDKKPEGKK